MLKKKIDSSMITGSEKIINSNKSASLGDISTMCRAYRFSSHSSMMVKFLVKFLV